MYGKLAFYNLIISIGLTYLIIILEGIFDWSVDTELLYDMVKISNSCFITVWAAIWGSGAIKKFKGTE
jgi:hypothetical protein